METREGHDNKAWGPDAAAQEEAELTRAAERNVWNIAQVQ